MHARSFRLLAPFAALALVLVLAAPAMAQGDPLVGMDTSAGESVFTANCAACHQVGGTGIPAAFPPLVDHVPAILSLDGGRKYIKDVLLFGTQGAITVEGTDYNGLMPAWGHLSDQQIADVLNYVATAWGNADKLPDGFLAFTPDEITARRADKLTSDQVHASRADLGLDGN